jgi:putative Ca2+/H+ antiporter (TMEM165/GDT1 family)
MDIFLLFSTFSILFIGELGDKTQLIVFNLSLEYKKSWKVGIGATLGFAAIVTFGIFLGVVISDLIPLQLVSLFSGIAFITIGILQIRELKKLWIERKRSNLEKPLLGNENENETSKKNNITSKFSKFKKSPILAGFIFIFLMELGDKTQVLTITIASLNSSLLEIWLGSFLALSTLAWLGVFIGALITKKLPKFYLKLISFALFLFIGVFLIISSL